MLVFACGTTWMDACKHSTDSVVIFYSQQAELWCQIGSYFRAVLENCEVLKYNINFWFIPGMQTLVRSKGLCTGHRYLLILVCSFCTVCVLFCQNTYILIFFLLKNRRGSNLCTQLYSCVFYTDIKILKFKWLRLVFLFHFLSS